MNASKSKVFKVEKEEKQPLHSELQSSSINGECDKLNSEKDEISPYEKKYFTLLQRCEIIKQSNETLVNRIYHVKKLLRRRKKERKFLMDRLDGHGDDYKSVALSLFAEMIGDASPVNNSQGSNKAESSQLLQSQTDLDL